MNAVVGLAEAARVLQARFGRRVVIGIVGAPGAGKSTIAARLVRELGDRAALIPMDGFHLAEELLGMLGRREHKGAPDTFDVAGYVALLRRLRDERGVTVYAPRYDRSIEEPIANAIRVEPSVDIIVTEGNYLLLPEHGWRDVRPLLDASWFVDVAEDVRLGRLVRRHVDVGKSADEARAWSYGPDEANAELVAPTREFADRIVENP